MGMKNIQQEEIIRNLGFEGLNEIQTVTAETSEINHNILLLAPTGSGKTVAFILGFLSHINDKDGVQVLILAPTRELVLQIESVLKKMKLPWKVNSAYGGHPFSVEKKNFIHPPRILVGTPGRIQDHLQRETLDASGIHHVVYDEFDKSLEFGFADQMEYIRRKLLNINGQTLVSATQNIEIPAFLRFFDYETLDFTDEDSNLLSLKQIIVPKDQKPEGLLQFINSLDRDKNVLVFVNHRDACDRIGDYFRILKMPYSIFHGGLEQNQREMELAKFRNGSSRVLIATDIASRGIDIPELDYVIHYQISPQENVFTHRNGRTARMKATGTALLIRSDQDKLPEYISEEPETLTFDKDCPVKTADWVTLYIGKGKKDKINKMDLVGFFLQFDFMKKEDLGLIEVKDYYALVAVNISKHKQLLKSSQGLKIKRMQPKIEVAQ